MAKFDLTPMQSQYVDPGYAKVAEVLRARYDETLEKKSLLDRAYAQVQVGQGDEWLVNNAKADGENILQSYSQNGNWESGAASLAIDDATNSLLSNRGVQVAQQSYKTRQAELEFINQQTLDGNNIWDFGSASFDQHQSYVQDEKGVWRENPYQVQNELELDYNGEMSSLVQSFGQDRYATDAYIDDVYNTYVSSQVGLQDYKRLALIQLRQQFPDASPQELAAMAEANIKDRLKSFTRQAQYENTVGSTNDYTTGDPTIVTEGAETSVKLPQGQASDPFSHSAYNMGILQNKDLPESERIGALRKNAEERLSSLSNAAEKTGNQAALAEYNDVYAKFENLAEETGDEKYLELFETINMLTSSTNASYHEVDGMGALSETAAWAAAGWATGSIMTAWAGTAVVPGLGTGAGYLVGGTGGMILGAGAGLLNWTAETMYEQFKGLNNVRDWERADGQEGWNWYNPVSWFSDDESTQLNDEMAKIDELNKAMPGANWTEKDIPQLQKLAQMVYHYKTEKGGDQLDQGWTNEGGHLDFTGQRFAGTKDGQAAQSAMDKALRIANPDLNFDVPGMSKKDREKLFDGRGALGTGNTKWSSASIQQYQAASPIYNTPTKIMVNVDGSSVMVETRPDWQNGQAAGWTTELSNITGNKTYAINERVMINLNRLKQSGKELTMRDYLDIKKQLWTVHTSEGEAQRRYDDEIYEMLHEELYANPSYTGTGMLRDAADGSKEYKNSSTNEWVKLTSDAEQYKINKQLGTIRQFRALYPTPTGEVYQMLLNDNTINGYY